MSAMPPLLPSLARSHDQFVVSHGKSGGVGVFTSQEPLRLRRGQRVLLQTSRGTEIGSVLCPASLLQARLLGATSSGQLLRELNSSDEVRLTELATLAEAIFETSRAWARRDGLALEILDAEACFDGDRILVQFVGAETGLESFVSELQRHFGRMILLENLAPPIGPEEEAGGCDKPDCGRSAGGGCTTCSTGDGCSSCGTGKVDLRDYFGHLRDKMDKNQRIPLV